MNNLQEAYVRGFCKTAEAYGVSPEKLMKSALDNVGDATATRWQSARTRRAAGTNSAGLEVGRHNPQNWPLHKRLYRSYFNGGGYGFGDGFDARLSRLKGAWQGVKDPEAWTAAGRNISRWVRTSPPPYGFSWDALKAPMQGAWQGLKDPDAWEEVGRNFRNGFNRVSPWQSDSSESGRTSYGTLNTDVPKMKPISYGPARQQVPFQLPPYESTRQPISDDFMQ